ncbi:hypothetical protein [Candidatus Tisiphia endosymbiont of Dascillus cervinus]|uniref:hypothetical protein n=1 Tax=Candidatus Tisiphia endosymbiont of Dascillus cervinus TaxID=3066253 RepID=UPI00312C8B3D
MKLVQKQQKEHAPIKQRADEHVENIKKIQAQKVDEHKMYHKIADSLSNSHPEKVKLKRFAQLMEEQHVAITTGTELVKNPDRDKIIEDRVKSMQKDPVKDKKSKLIAAVRFNANTTNRCVIDSSNPTPNVTGKRGTLKEDNKK